MEKSGKESSASSGIVGRLVLDKEYPPSTKFVIPSNTEYEFNFDIDHEDDIGESYKAFVVTGDDTPAPSIGISRGGSMSRAQVGPMPERGMGHVVVDERQKVWYAHIPGRYISKVGPYSLVVGSKVGHISVFSARVYSMN
jgi:hypothetical protein